MSNSYIVSGCLFGDEGKGTLVDYLAHKYNLKENIRYNGGSHASHTVIVDGTLHKFSQLGSAFLNNDVRTYLSENTVVNPFNLITEAKVLGRNTGKSVEEILSRIYISENAKVVTPYHSIICKVRELSSGNNRTGRVGTGVSEVARVKEATGIELKIKDILSGDYKTILLSLFDFTRNFVLKNRTKISKEKYYKYLDTKEIDMLIDPKNKEYLINCYENIMASNLLNIVSDILKFHQEGDILFEGSQAVLIDKDYGIKPNTTALDTTNLYAVKLAKTLESNIIRFGCISALSSRHGMGVLPTYDEYLQNRIFDENQVASYFQGVPRYGWFDALLIRYSLKYSPNDELFMSALDRLSKLKVIKVCNEYEYFGDIDEEFQKIFTYYIRDNKVFITDIIQNSENLKKYLLKCQPVYITLPGFDNDIGQIKKYEDLPIECLNFVELVEELIGTKITLVGVGPDRSQKLVRKRKHS